MIELRQAGCESWLNVEHARLLCARLGDELWARCEGHRGLFVTLTYRRDEWRTAEELYHKTAEEQHVPLFLRKVSRYLGESLKGRWFCKLEFQGGGWVHWHLIILDVERIPHDVCTELWGHGHVWLRRLNRKNVKYCTKYVAKAGALPAWVMLAKPRSLKVVRVSPGFWRSPSTPRDASDAAADPDDRFRLMGVHEPIGERIERARGQVVARDERGVYVRGRADLGTLLVALLKRGCSVVGRRGRWLVLDATLNDLHATLGVGAERSGGEAARPPALHLIGTGNPDALPVWLDDWLRERATVDAESEAA